VAQEASGGLSGASADGIGEALSPAELADLATVAEANGWTLEQAVARIGWQQSFGFLLDDLRARFPAEYAGAGIEPSGNPWIGFRGDVPERALAAVAAFETRVFAVSSPGGDAWATYRVVVRRDRGFSESELDDRLVAAHYAAYAQKDLVSHVSSGYDIETGAISVEIEPTAAAKDDAEAVVTQLVARSALLEGVTIRVVDNLGDGGDANLFGGVAMSNGCTSGFTVIKNGTQRGITTAGHCGDTASMSGVTLTFQDDYIGTWGDFQWHTAATHQDDFYAGSATQTQYDLRDVTGVGSPYVDQQLCKNGVATHRTCDFVFQLNACDDGACHLVAMDHRLAAPGDSGGPVYWGNTAYGLHQGHEYVGGAWRDEFSIALYLYQAFAGVYVLSG
jgi:hypothetical protein